jgi:NAD(P)H-dependent flavin oxidoreductase YrpB (nitropropane dioxygenase family)
VVDRLHAGGIPVMNMIGHPKHIANALEAGVDIFCAQGGEGGGHTGDIAFSVRHLGELTKATVAIT